MTDDLIILMILVTNCLAKRLCQMKLITDHQQMMIQRWLTTSSKKAERRY